MSNEAAIKADRKNAADAAASDKGSYEVTPFGRRKVKGWRNVLSPIIRLGTPLVSIFRQQRRPLMNDPASAA